MLHRRASDLQQEFGPTLASKRPFGADSSPNDPMAQPAKPESVESKIELLTLIEKILESSACPGWNFFIELLTWLPFSR
jgi:hypothetical protein